MKKIQTAAFGMPEHEMRWEGKYRPRISPEHLHSLWMMKQQSGKPIAKLVEDALEQYFENQKGGEKT